MQPHSFAKPARLGHAPNDRQDAQVRGIPGLVTTTTNHTLSISAKEMKLRRMRRSVVLATEVMQESLQRGGFRFRAAMITLTYAEIGAWRPNHIADFTKLVRSWLERRGYPFRNVWVGELQRRGALHYHIMLWLPRGLTLPKPDKQGWWSHGSTRIEFARKPVAYMAKYSSKGHGDTDHGFPKGCRTHGRGGLAEAIQTLRYRLLPEWLKDQVTPCDRLKRRSGGYLSITTGIFYPSHWRLSGHSPDFKNFTFERVDPKPRPYFLPIALPAHGLPIPGRHA